RGGGARRAQVGQVRDQGDGEELLRGRAGRGRLVLRARLLRRGAPAGSGPFAGGRGGGKRGAAAGARLGGDRRAGRTLPARERAQRQQGLEDQAQDEGKADQHPGGSIG